MLQRPPRARVQGAPKRGFTQTSVLSAGRTQRCTRLNTPKASESHEIAPNHSLSSSLHSRGSCGFQGIPPSPSLQDLLLHGWCCSHQDTTRRHPLCESARAMDMGAVRVQPGALHPEQSAVLQGPQCCPALLRMVGLFCSAAHPLLLGGEKILGILGRKYSFLSPHPCFSVLQTSTHRFFTVGDMLTRQHQFLTSLQYSDLRQVQPMYWRFAVLSLPKTQTLPKKLLQHHSSELWAHVPCGQGHIAGHDAMRMLSAYQ